MSSDDEIRALLRDAGATEAMPADVAARLDDVLAGLAATPPVPEEPVVLPLRRRLAPRLLAAAAAVVLVTGVGVGLNEVLRTGSSPSADSAGGGEAASGDDGRAEVLQDEDTPAPSALDRATDGALLSRQTLDADLVSAARRLKAQASPAPAESGSPEQSPATPYLAESKAYDEARCATPPDAAVDGALTQLVDFEGMPALLVVGPEGAAGTPVSLWRCDTDALVVRDVLDLD